MTKLSPGTRVRTSTGKTGTVIGRRHRDDFGTPYTAVAVRLDPFYPRYANSYTPTSVRVSLEALYDAADLEVLREG